MHLTPTTASRWADLAFILVVVIDFFCLGSARLNAAIRAVAAQGVLLSGLAILFAEPDQPIGHVIALPLIALLVKGVAVPRLLFRAMREAGPRQEDRPVVGFVPSLLLGAIGVALAFAFARSLPLPSPERHGSLVPTALATAWTGLLLVISRTKASTQVLGFLVFENGVFLIGLLLSGVMPFMVEAGLLLDLVAAVFVMGIVMFHINREFSSIDTEKLTALKD
jgi:hydrogenase-4 component E